jgi:hypothetical protein
MSFAQNTCYIAVQKEFCILNILVLYSFANKIDSVKDITLSVVYWGPLLPTGTVSREGRSSEIASTRHATKINSLGNKNV